MDKNVLKASVAAQNRKACQSAQISALKKVKEDKHESKK